MRPRTAVRGLSEAQNPSKDLPALGRSGAAVKKFVDLIDLLTEEKGKSPGVGRTVELVLRLSGLTEHYKDDENASANLGELVTAAGQFDQETDFSATLNDWLCEVALVSDVDAIDPELGAVTMMTLHAAKGLEFPLVFIVGCESGIIPMEREGRVSDLEEERRLLFVGITRTMRKLTLTHVAERMLHGKTIQPTASQFIAEIPADVLDQQDLVSPDFQPMPQMPAWSRWRPTASSSSASSGAGGGFGWRKRPGGQPGQHEDDDIDRTANKFDAPSREFSREDAAALRQAEQESTQSRTGWPVGTLVRHPKFGIGKVIRVTPSGPFTKATIDFRTGGLKAVILEMAKVERLLG
jgi:DNA helicase-2/ATP-dependent DNA helicase PcrA